MKFEVREDNDDYFLGLGVDLMHAIKVDDLSVRSVWRSRAAREIAAHEPSPLNAAFIQVMDDPKPMCDVLRDRGLDDWMARSMVSGLPIAAVGGYGLKPEHFDISKLLLTLKK